MSGVQYKDVVLLGKFNTPLSDLKKLIRIAGGRVHHNVAIGVDMVVVGDKDNRVPTQAARQTKALILPVITESQLLRDLEGFELHWRERAPATSHIRKRKTYYVPNDASLDFPRSSIVKALRNDGHHVLHSPDGVDFIVTSGKASVLDGEVSDQTLAKRYGIQRPSSSWQTRQRIQRKKVLLEQRAKHQAMFKLIGI